MGPHEPRPAEGTEPPSARTSRGWTNNRARGLAKQTNARNPEEALTEVSALSGFLMPVGPVSFRTGLPPSYRSDLSTTPVPRSRQAEALLPGGPNPPPEPEDPFGRPPLPKVPTIRFPEWPGAPLGSPVRPPPESRFRALGPAASVSLSSDNSKVPHTTPHHQPQTLLDFRDTNPNFANPHDEPLDRVTTAHREGRNVSR